MLLLLSCTTALTVNDSDAVSAEDADADGDGFSLADGDCDDADASVHPDAEEVCDAIDSNCDGNADGDLLVVWYEDLDEDGFGGAAGQPACEIPVGGTTDATDCDDHDANAFPNNPERCDAVDNNCDAAVDEGVTNTFYADADEDSFGDATASTEACEQPAGYLTDQSDCDDADDGVNPAQAEVCDEKDNDCDGEVDDGVTIDWYVDYDADGWGDTSVIQAACVTPTGYAQYAGDCDNADADYNPGADEPDCTDPNDYNCDGSVGYADADADGWAACAECDDADATNSPDAAERCDLVDNDCDGDVDEASAVDATTWWIDYDGDGYGSTRSTTIACDAPALYVGNDDDCDDTEATISPVATESCNGEDDDCDTSVDEGFDSDTDGIADCADAEECDGADNDGDGEVDEGVGSIWYADDDGDGFGDAGDTTSACDAPPDFTSNDDDCDDTSADVSPDATDTCNGVDDDCDGDTDEGGCLDVSNVSDETLTYGTSALVVAGDATVDTETGEISGIRGAGTGLVDGVWFTIVSQADGPSLGVFAAEGISVASGVTLSVEGDYALVLLSEGDATIAGTIDAKGEDAPTAYVETGPNAPGQGIAGGADGGYGSDNAYVGATSGGGSGAGSIGVAGIHYGNGGGGAGACWGGGGGMGDRPSVAGSAGSSSGGGAGGYAGGDGGRGGNGGGPYGVATLSPLYAGSGGAGGQSDTDKGPNGAGAGGGGGGGGVQLSVEGALTVSGTIDASGGTGGDAWGGGGGGGSGGGILLEAVDIDVSGSVKAEGGRGGHGNRRSDSSSTTGGTGGKNASPGGGGGGNESGGGGGAAGWIYLRGMNSETVSGSLSPDETTGCGG